MDAATDVILGGCSSGAVSTLFTINIWRQLMHWVPNVLAFADSGYFLDLDNYSMYKNFIIEHQNASASLVPECVRQNAQKPWVCFVAANVLRYAKAPVFAWQSRYDTNQLGGYCDTDTCSMEFGTQLQASMEAVMASQSQGFFIDGCSRHCSGAAPALGANGHTPLRAIFEWYHNYTVRIVQSGAYPCDSCCSAAYVNCDSTRYF
eukprot:TRINITY_DN80961_c0_g1_i1.p1 TRINITY_DN80961_c0_g1~~TRINITY_DN80961_c0_g1_i1.p1  ORF type:complete len:240 (+),score=21.04 TRINITY_DN80961_c0_g1_i1:106-720(+)